MEEFLPFIVIGLTAGSVYGLAGTGLVLTYKTSGVFNFAYGAIAAVAGEDFNMKVTTPDDFQTAERLLLSQMGETRTGSGKFRSGRAEMALSNCAGRAAPSDFASASPLNVDRPGSAASFAVSIGAAPLPSPVDWKEAVRTVTTLIASTDCTVWMALPA